MKLVKLTAPNGKAVWVVPAWVQSVRSPIAGDHPEARAILIMSGNAQGVKEPAADVVAALEGA